MCRGGQSKILTFAARIADFLCAPLANSGLLILLCRAYPALETRWRNSFLGGFGERGFEEDSRQYRWRRYFMYQLENSAFTRLSQWFGDVVLRGTVGSLGNFLFLYGSLSAALWFVSGTGRVRTLAAALLLVILSIPLLRSSKTLAASISNSFMIGSFLFDFCGLARDRFSFADHGAERPWSALATAILFAGVSRFFTPLHLIFLTLILLSLILLFSVPELSICIFLFMFPIFSVLPHPTYTLCAAALAVHATWLRRVLCGRRSFRFSLIDCTVFGLCMLYLLAALTGAGGRASLFSGAVTALLLSLWFPTVSLLSNERWRRRAAGACTVSLGFCALWGIIQYFFTDMELKWVDVSRFSDIGGRVTACFLNPNVFAVFLLISVPYALVMSCTARSFALRLLSGICMLAGALCLLLTWSRGAWLGAIFGFLLFLLLHGKVSRGLLLLLPLPVASALPFIPHAVRNRFSSIGSFAESSVRYRLYTWRGIGRMLREHPFGVGAGREAFSTVYRNFAVSGTETVVHPHNLFLRVWCELGIGGLIVFLFFVGLLILCAMRLLSAMKEGERRTLTLGCFCALCGVLVMGMFDDIWYHYGMTALFWINCAMLTAAEEESR